MKRVAENLGQLKTHFSYLSTTIRKWPVKVELVDGYSERTDRQNKVFHMHFAEIGKFEGWDPKYSKCYCKLEYGMPIIAGRNSSDGEWYAWALDHLENIPFEEQIKWAKKVPVTSEFTPKEGAEFIDTLMREWAMKGCELTDPKSIDPDHYKDLEREARSRGEV